jgi:hypothetical protein
MVLGGQAVSAAVWPDAISELIPEVDYLLIGRQELAHKGLLGRGRKESFVVPFKEIAADVTPYAVSQYSLPAYSLPAPRVPEPIRDRVRKLQAGQAPGELLSMDHVLDAEIVARVRAGRGG